MKKYLIVNNTFVNKGDQARAFAIMTKYPGKYKILNNFTEKWENQEDYIPEIKRLERKQIIKAILGIENETWKDFKEADKIFDCSGYSLTSEHDKSTTINTLTITLLAKRTKTPIRLIAQTIGPFKYSFPWNIIFKITTPLIMKNTEIEARNYPSKENKTKIEKYLKTEIEFKRDPVLEIKKYDINGILTERGKNKMEYINIPKGTTIIIPNNKIKDKTKIKILGNNIKRKIIIYTDNDKKLDIPETKEYKDLNCIEIENIIKQAERVITQRYHGAIFARKYGIPVLIDGWTEKYDDLMKQIQEGTI